MAILDRVNSVTDLKRIQASDLPKLCDEIREFLIETVQETGGHLGASLGTVELTVVLHYLLLSPTDKLVWDVSHQAYTHKILTGRKDRMKTLRKSGGLYGFTDPAESEHDFFKVGHASTSIAQAMGLAVARDYAGRDEKIIAIIGDGALTGGLAYEALNNAGHTKRDILIILNDNEMSIAPNVGAMSKYFNSMITNPLYNRVRKKVETSTDKFPRLQKLIQKAEEGFKNIIVPGILFEELGFRYFGPLDGHDVPSMLGHFERIINMKGPRIMHILTKKGMGCELAEKDPEKLHGVSPKKSAAVAVDVSEKKGAPALSYTQVFSNAISDLAESNSDVIAITAAMPSGTGLADFQKKFPDRFFDVGIAEQYAVSFAGALAKGGKKPVCAIYSTFLQRAVDQIIHDVSLQNQNVVFAIDRAGVVGEDGPTHHGLFDMAYMRAVPGSVLGSPKDSIEMKRMLELGINAKGIFAFRYARDKVAREFPESSSSFEVGEGEVLKEGSDLTILTLGSMISNALLTAELLEAQGVSAGVMNMRFAKPIDRHLLEEAVGKTDLIVTMEEHMLHNGFGSACLEALSDLKLKPEHFIRLGFGDSFPPHATRTQLLESACLTPESAAQRILKEVPELCRK